MLGRLRGGLYDGGDMIGSTLGESLAMTNDSSFIREEKKTCAIFANKSGPCMEILNICIPCESNKFFVTLDFFKNEIRLQITWTLFG